LLALVVAALLVALLALVVAALLVALLALVVAALVLALPVVFHDRFCSPVEVRAGRVPAPEVTVASPGSSLRVSASAVGEGSPIRRRSRTRGAKGFGPESGASVRLRRSQPCWATYMPEALAMLQVGQHAIDQR
jgi:hypothetical protein